MSDFIIFIVGFFITLMVCGGLFYGAIIEFIPPTFRKESEKPIKNVRRTIRVEGKSGKA